MAGVWVSVLACPSQVWLSPQPEASVSICSVGVSRGAKDVASEKGSRRDVVPEEPPGAPTSSQLERGTRGPGASADLESTAVV